LAVAQERGEVSLGQVRGEKRLPLLLLLLLLLSRQLRGRVLTGLKTETLSIQLSILLQSLELGQLERVQLLTAAEHLRGGHHHLTLRKLDELRLSGVLELANGANGLVHRGAGTMTRLEATALTETLLLILALTLVVGLTPVAVKVAGRGSGVSRLATTAVVLRSIVGLGELKATGPATR
jgi:hypothetical protein